MRQKTEIELLIERFFDCTATPGEEARLKALLADPSTAATPAVEEARAVLGYTAVLKAIEQPDRERHRKLGSNRSRWLAAASVAAAIAVTATLGAYLIRSQSTPSTAVVYAQGKVSRSTEQALSIMAAQLGAMNDATTNSAAAEMLRSLEATTTISPSR